MNKAQKDLRLLPNSFKKVAYGLLILTVLFTALVVLNLIAIEKDLAKTILKTGTLLSLLLLALTRDKIEDELTLHIRVKAFAFTFIFGVAYTIAWPFVNLVFDGKFLFDEIDAEGLLLTMFFVYFGMMNMMKRNR